MAQLLRKNGYRAWALEGGYQAWRAAGYPTQAKEAELGTSLSDICPQCKTAMTDHL